MVMVEKDASVAAMLNQQVELLQAPAISVQQASAESFLSSSGKPVGKIHRQSFDIVFVDPPFEARLQGPILDQLFSTDLLKPGALIYVESPRESDWQDAFEVHLSVGQFDQLRSKQTGNVIYQLFRKA